MMKKVLRPRTKGPPADHNYASHNPSGLAYSPTQPSALSTTIDVANERAIEDGGIDPMDHALRQNYMKPATSKVGGCKKKKRKRKGYDFERKQKRVKRVETGQGSTNYSDYNAQSMCDFQSLSSNLTEQYNLYGHVDLQHSIENPALANGQQHTRPLRKRQKGKVTHHRSRESERLKTKNMKLPFDNFPNEIKLKILSYLTPEEKAKARLVSIEWSHLNLDWDAWRHIDLNMLGEGFISKLKEVTKQWRKQKTQKALYDKYQTRLREFDAYISQFRPMPTSLCFSFDLGNYMDNWFQQLDSLLTHMELGSLRLLSCNWQVTSFKPGHLEKYCCVYNKVRTLFRLHILRRQVFHKLLESLSHRAPLITQFEMPFDWSPRSGLLLSRFKCIQVLKLSNYMSLPGLNQDVLSAVLRALPALIHLEITIVAPTFNHTTLYEIVHDHLQVLHLKKCKGFYLRRLHAKSLKEFHCDRLAWPGFNSSNQSNHLSVPCLTEVFSQGVPNLVTFNNVPWTRGCMRNAPPALKQVCPCSVHWKDAENDN